MSAEPQLTRVERRKLELRREIIDAAFELFTDKGYHATGIADIAARLGMGHGTFYRYFENKRDIVEHVIDDLIGRILAILTEENAPGAVDTIEDYGAQSARIGAALSRILLADPRIPRMILLQAPGIDPAMAQRIQDFFAMADALTAEYLEHGVRLGYLRGDLDVAASATAINGMLLGSAFASIRTPDPDMLLGLNEAIWRIMHGGISA